eukprot:GILI01001097.1.p2 GENE.GILI01001097.1~~GILI01001097.1.p2  ORF type:complete len:718 (+),score=300.49 GILI01001097.1:103-2256(+)
MVSSRFSSVILLGLLICCAGVYAESLRQRFKDEYNPSAIPEHPSIISDAPRFAEVGSFIHEGWLKYFIYSSNQKARPKSFYVNDASASGQGGPTPNSFYFVLTKNTLLVLREKGKPDAAVGSLNIANVDPVNPGPPATGGIEDQGSFKEGFCWSLKSSGKDSENENWELCADSQEQKNAWIGAFLSVVKKVGQENGGGDCGGDSNVEMKNDGVPQDGKWIMVQDWSKCSVSCGGGVSVRQRFCVPPKNGGKNCEGEATEVRKCNTEPCPAPTINLPPITNPPQVRVMPINTSPGRYEECVIKEGSMFVQTDANGASPPAKVPAHVILNNRTLTIYENENIDTVQNSVELEDIQLPIKAHREDPENCIVVKALKVNKKLILCVMGPSNGMSAQENRDEWADSIAHFKEDCLRPMETDMKAYVDSKVQDAQEEFMHEKAAKLDEEKEREREAKMDEEVEGVAAQAMNALQKELAREQLEEKEEEEREREEEKDIEKHLKEEEDKQKCIKEQIEKKKKSQGLKRHQAEVEEKIREIKAEAEAQLKLKKARMQKKLAAMRAASERRRAGLMRKIEVFRAQMTEEMMEAERMGNASACAASVMTEDKRSVYCSTKLANEPDKMLSCKEVENFCAMCCEAEFGDLHEDERIDCEKGCQRSDGSAGAAGAAGDDGMAGRWVFIPDVNDIEGAPEAQGTAKGVESPAPSNPNNSGGNAPPPPSKF